MKLDAECTWGDGPDVLLSVYKDGKVYELFDLTIEEAFDLASRLTMAAQYARHHEETAAEGDKVFGFRATPQLSGKASDF